MLKIAFEENGRPDGWPVLLMHGFPYDVHAYDAVTPILVSAGARVIVPWLRGYGPTRFLSPETPRSGEQAALGKDLLDLLDALQIRSALLAGYDWGGRAACIVSALWPQRVQGLVSQNSYNIQDIARSGQPQARKTRCAFGTSITSIPSAGVGDWRRTGAPSAACCGASGRRSGSSMTRLSRERPRASTIRISWRLSSTPTGTGSDW
ncbi:alpha/beta fold hydrolase [Pseudoroseomonas wenyumeiae]